MFKPIRLWCCGLVVLMLALVVQSVLASPAYQEAPCVGEPPCYEPPTSVGPTKANTAGPTWGGFSDGRLNPDMAEYYSVWCQDGVVRVLRGVPTTAFIDDIPIEDVTGLADGGSLARDSGLTIARTRDAITIYGSNGNLTAPGSKSFLLAQCLERNGNAAIVQQSVIDPNSDAAGLQASNAEYSTTNTVTGDNEPFNPWQLIIDIIAYFVKLICGGNLGLFGAGVFIIPAGRRAWTRRKQNSPL